MFMELRKYQSRLLSEIMSSQESGIVSAPTGSGKSLIMATLGQRVGGRVVYVASELSVRHQLIHAYGVPEDDVMYVSTFLNYAASEPDISLIIIDEAHHFREGNRWHAVIDIAEASHTRWIGFTATPIGVLPKWSISYSELREEHWIGNVPIGVECESVEEALRVTEDIPTVTYISAPWEDNYDPRFGRLITADTPPEDRHFRDGEMRLCCMMTLTTGWDDPNIGAVILARRISELQTYMQILGRLRRGGLVADLSNNIARYGLDDDANVAELVSATAAEVSGGGLPVLIKCTECERLCSPRTKGHCCPYCGATLPPPAPSTRFWTRLEGDFLLEWEKLFKDIDKKCRTSYPRCPFTPSGAWPSKLPRYSGPNSQIFLSPKTAGHWVSVARILRSCLKDKSAVLFASGQHIMLRDIGCTRTFIIDLSYGSSLTWKRF